MSVTHTDDAVEIVIGDDGMGIPPPMHETSFSLDKRGPERDGDGI